jgi:hypothetical protein
MSPSRDARSCGIIKPIGHTGSYLIAALVLALVSTSCGQPAASPPPPQVVLPSGPEPAGATASSGERLLVAMSDSDANAHILGDVSSGLDDGEFRFTGLHPQFLVRVENAKDLQTFH